MTLIQVRKLWKAGMKITRGVGVRDTEARPGGRGPAGGKGSSDEEPERKGDEERETESGSEGQLLGGQGPRGQQAEGMSNDQGNEAEISGKEEVTNGSIESDERGERDALAQGRPDEDYQRSGAGLKEPTAGSGASGVDGSRVDNGPASFEKPQADAEGSQNNVHSEDSETANSSLVADKVDAGGISEESKTSGSPSWGRGGSDPVADHHVAKLEEEDRILEVLERSARQDEVLEGVADSLN